VRYSDWYGIYSEGGSLSITDSTIADNGSTGVSVYGQPLTLVGSTIANNGANGLSFDEDGAPESLVLLDNVFNGNGGYAAMIHANNTGESFFADLTTFSGNSGSGNGHDAIYLHAYITGTTVLTPQTGLVYLFYYANINSGSSLTLEPGVVVKFYSSSSGLYVYGALDAQGTAGEPVVFTSYKDDAYGGDTNGDGGGSTPAPFDWEQIYVASGASATLSHTVVRYGGDRDGDDYYPMIENYGSLTMENCDVRYSDWYGIYSEGGSLSITDSTIADNGSTGSRCYCFRQQHLWQWQLRSLQCQYLYGRRCPLQLVGLRLWPGALRLRQWHQL